MGSPSFELPHNEMEVRHIYIYIYGTDVVPFRDRSRNIFSLICFIHFSNFKYTCQIQIKKNVL